MGYAARTKYDEPGRAARYAARNPRRAAEEAALLSRTLDALPIAPRTALDAPCGAGRVTALLLDRGIPTRAADLSPAMREEARRRLRGRKGFEGVFPLDLEAPHPPEALRADLVICFRFLHHLPDAATRARVLTTLRRLTGRDLLLGFHHPVSAHGLARALRVRLGGRPSDRHAIAPRRLAREAAAAGFALARLWPLARWRRELWVAWLK